MLNFFNVPIFQPRGNLELNTHTIFVFQNPRHQRIQKPRYFPLETPPFFGTTFQNLDFIGFSLKSCLYFYFRNPIKSKYKI